MDLDREAILRGLREAKPQLAQRFPLRRIALFGSFARGDATPESDIDILVEVDPSIGLGFVTLAEELEKLIGHRVDLVSRRGVKALLWEQIEPDLIDV